MNTTTWRENNYFQLNKQCQKVSQLNFDSLLTKKQTKFHLHLLYKKKGHSQKGSYICDTGHMTGNDAITCI